MSLDCCLFTARMRHPSDRPLLEGRLSALLRFYEPAGARAIAVRSVSERTVVGSIRFDGGSDELDRPVVFGEPLPRELSSASAILDADERGLRRLEGSVVALAAAGDRARVVAGAGAPSTIYSAASSAVRAWSSHGVAAGWLAQGEARLAHDAIPELLATQFVGGERTLIQGVNALPLATCVSLDANEVRVGSYWPPSERWELVPEEDAHAAAERALLTTLERRLAASAHPFCSLTSGLDSRVAAVAMRELGLSFEAFTWGAVELDEAGEPPRVATALGVPHHVEPIIWLDDEEAMREAHRQVRMNEGANLVGFGRVTWPTSATSCVTGGGGELARAFYYSERARATGGEPEDDALADVLHTAFAGRLASARPSAQDDLRARTAAWVAAAERHGARGWRALDVVYGEQRLRRWLRGMLPLENGAMAPAFATPEVQRALISLPLADRLGDGFHRRFLAAHCPAVAARSPAPAHPRKPSLMARLRARLPLELQPLRRERSPLTGRWASVPGFRAWLVDGVLGSRPIEDAMGRRWAAATRRRFLHGDTAAEELTLWAAGPLLLAEALRDLKRERGSGIAQSKCT